MIHWKSLLAAAAVSAIATSGSVAWATQSVKAGNTVAPAGGVKALGGGTTEAKFIPVEPCRILDTRIKLGRPAVKEIRSFAVRGAGPAFAAQGGKAGGCGIPVAATGVEFSISATDPDGKGFLRAFPGPDEPQATIVNYELSSTNTGTIQLCPTACAGADMKYKVYTHQTEVVMEVQGYYIAPLAAAVTAEGLLVADQSSRAVAVTKEDVGAYKVTFDRDVSTCLPSVTALNLDPKAIGSFVLGTEVLVVTSGGGTAVDTPFSLTVTC
ncbi:MAG: hypothetical protein JWM47_2755 [Acidimicrobiales bacterium]|nr:hypothetical protein [Acidimicrobiales bacterium]